MDGKADSHPVHRSVNQPALDDKTGTMGLKVIIIIHRSEVRNGITAILFGIGRVLKIPDERYAEGKPNI